MEKWKTYPLEFEFEEDLANNSDKYKEYLNIPLMIERWSREKIFTAFAYYLYTKKTIEL